MKILFLLPFVLAAHLVAAQCDSTQITLRLEIDPDYWYDEVSWNITDSTGAVLDTGYAVNAEFQVYTYCVSKGQCLAFHIVDSYGDGIAPDGFYRVFLNDSLWIENLTGQYGLGESKSFGCSPGFNCDNPLPLDTGLYTTPGSLDAWYHFQPPSNGIYRLSTCDLGNTCPSKIWVYDRCPVTPTNDNLGTIFYADNGCTTDSLGASATLLLAANQHYLIRMGYDGAADCDTTPLAFTFSYVGAIVGCTDPLACNYNPLATVSDTCVYPGSPDCTNLPDLMVVEETLRNSLVMENYSNSDACAVQEGCIRGTGFRTILRFSTHIKNIGVADYYIGQVPATPETPSDQFVFDACHNHWHYRGYAEYVVFNAAGERLPLGSKNGFCVLDLECEDGGQGKYTCEEMGITAGCGDIYDASLPCQWIDITGLPAGDYTLAVRVNWDKSPDKLGHPELTYDNNWGQVCFNLSYAGNQPQFTVLDSCPPYVDCTGVAYGDAVYDCNGVCNGTALRGDLNADSLRNLADVVAYLDAARLGDQPTAACTDLYLDDQLNVYDAALLQECALHGNDLQYWGTRFACQFPAGVYNATQAASFSLGALDTVEKTLVLRIRNISGKLIGFELDFSGMEISSVENLDTTFNAPWLFNNATGRILALAPDSLALNKHTSMTPFIRLHYSQLTASSVCLNKIRAVVNQNYQLIRTLMPVDSCVEIITVGIGEPLLQEWKVAVRPNPAASETTLFFDNPDDQPVDVLLLDPTGRLARRYNQLRTDNVTLQRGDLPAGLYTFQLRSEKGTVSGKILFQ